MQLRQTILGRIEGSWHSANLINSSAAGYLLVDVPVTSVKQWSDRLAALRQVAVIKNVTIRTLDTNGGSISLALVGSREALQNALASHDLVLVDTGDMISIIAKSDGNEWLMRDVMTQDATDAARYAVPEITGAR